VRGTATDICARFGKRVRQLRTERGWTQIDLAVHAGLGRVFISDVERGKKEPCLRSVEILAIAFEMTIPQLFRSV
jgi:transcriptional regulator with XRE-family HTH domain